MPKSRNSPDNVFLTCIEILWGWNHALTNQEGIKRRVESTPAASDKFEEKESCFQYIANVGALQKSHVLRFQNRIRTRIGDSEFDFTIMIAFLHATKAESQTSRHQKDLCHHRSRRPRYPVRPQHFGPEHSPQRVQADEALASDGDPVCSIDDWP